MRTTIDLSPAHRAQLARLAAERGERGFSRFIAEALEAYLDRRTSDEGRDGPRLLRGVLGGPEARDLEERVRMIREDWR